MDTESGQQSGPPATEPTTPIPSIAEPTQPMVQPAAQAAEDLGPGPLGAASFSKALDLSDLETRLEK